MVFEWDVAKEAANIGKHGIDFSTVPAAFEDPQRLVIPDALHSTGEARLYCIGHDGRGIFNNPLHVAGRENPRNRRGLLEKTETSV